MLFSQNFIGETGIFILNAANSPISISQYDHSFIDGGVARTKWEDLEPVPGVFNWSFLDNEIATAKSVGKKLSIAILRQPSWLVDSLNADSYLAVDYNVYHSTYLDTFQYAVKYDRVVINRYKILMDSLAERYSNNSNIAYFHIFSSISNDLPITVADETPYYQAVFYNPDTLINRLKELTRYYMNLFPTIPLWNSPDAIRFEKDATGLPKNYVAKAFMDWGAVTYPKRFGVWREDLSGCVIVTAEKTDTHWYVMSEHSCRNGSQMVWNTQDGPSRMNNCNMTLKDDSPESKVFVLDSAINAGLSINMRYYEIYSIDLRDTDLQVILQVLHDRIADKIIQNCDTSSGITFSNSRNDREELVVSPNPSKGQYSIMCNQKISRIEIIDISGHKKIVENITPDTNFYIDLTGSLAGIYLVRAFTGEQIYSRKLIKTE